MRGWWRGGVVLSAFVNMCLGHLHRAMRASICCAAGKNQSQSFAHPPSRDLNKNLCCTLPQLTVTLCVKEQERALPHFSQ